jgi:hypothetical protein
MWSEKRSNQTKAAVALAFADERAGQLDFFKKFGLDATLADYTDGVFRGTLFEFKLTIDRPSRVLSQAIKYLSRMRNRGRSVPAHILLIELSTRRAYHYHSADYLAEIERQYKGPPSLANDGFSAEDPVAVIDYGDFDGDQTLSKVIADERFTRVHIDLYDVVGWADRFYDENPKATKLDLFNELRSPTLFAELIHPWEGDEGDFRYIMDCLNDRQHRKELGAFYTPPEYAKLSVGLVRRAIATLPVADCDDAECPHRYEGECEHKHYVIVDRCAGSGDLEEPLTDEELSHTIVATYELKEWVVLNSRFGGRVRAITPPTPDHDRGLLHGGDALAQAVFSEVAPYIADPTCNVILLENPPYSDASGDAMQTGEARGTTKSTVVAQQMRENFSSKTKGLQATKEMANLFIWSAWFNYLAKPNDAFILYAPIKYWKTHELANKKFIDGFLFNRKHFHASPSAIACILWTNADDATTEAIRLRALDIKDGAITDEGEIEVRKVHKSFNEKYFDKHGSPEDSADGIYCGTNGYETQRQKATTAVNLYSPEILGYLHLIGFALDRNNVALTRAALPRRKNGFFLRRDNFQVKLPLFAAKSFPQRKWYEKDVYCTSADGGDAYERDEQLIKACFLWTCLTQANHCMSLDGTDRRRYLNELCFDEGTAASQFLAGLKLTGREQVLVRLWRAVRDEAAKIDEAADIKKLNPSFTYGPYQIDKEINTSTKDERGRKVYDHSVLNDKLAQLKIALVAYYDEVILPRLFAHDLLK